MDKRELIRLAKEYIDIPKEKKIVYRVCGGGAEISFSAEYEIIGVYREYITTVRYIDFMGSKRLEIESVGIDVKDSWNKVIEL